MASAHSLSPSSVWKASDPQPPAVLSATVGASGATLFVNTDISWMELPAQLGGARLNILRRRVLPVCVCGQRHPNGTTEFTLERDWLCCHCPVRGFAWLRRRRDGL